MRIRCVHLAFVLAVAVLAHPARSASPIELKRLFPRRLRWRPNGPGCCASCSRPR